MAINLTFNELGLKLAEITNRQFTVPKIGYWVYGAGNFGQSIALALENAGQKICGFIDRDASRLDINSRFRCIRPEDITDEDIEDCFYVHGIMNYLTPSTDPITWARTKPFAQILYPQALYSISGFQMNNYWLAHPKETLKHLKTIETVYESFEEDETRKVFADLLIYRLSGNPTFHPDVEFDTVYVPDFLPIYNKPIKFIDGGAYTGDTVEHLLAHGVSIDDWIAFEPDKGNAILLSETARRLNKIVPNYTLIRAGLADRSGIVKFSSSGSQASHVVSDVGASEEGDVSEINVVRFDEIFHRSGLVYVKMDIEGAEREALAGMSNLIDRRPILAISIYHRPSDLWEIPSIVRKMYSSSDLRIRQHGYSAFETVLYVTPYS